jgi:hypothetical protein
MNEIINQTMVEVGEVVYFIIVFIDNFNYLQMIQKVQKYF